MRKLTFVAVIFLLATAHPAAQQLDPTITLQADRLDPTYQSNLENLKYDLEQYIDEYEYTDDVYGTTVPILYQIYFEQASESGTQTVYTAQLLVTNRTDQRYFDKTWEFAYTSGQTYQHGIYTAVTAVIDFYAYLILAGEVDTYGRLAGTPYYNTAREIINQASGLGRGWQDRLKRLDDLQNHRDLRMLRYTFFDAYWDYQESNTSDARIGFQDSMKLVGGILNKNRDDKYTKIFLEGNADKMAWLAGELEDYNALKTLISVDPNNKNIYQGYLP